MNLKEAANRYLHEGSVMQLATLHSDQPRVNSLYYVVSDDFRAIYWLSEAMRRHSQDIQQNSKVGGAIVIKTDLPVIGLQFEGEASEVLDIHEQKNVIERYNTKYEDAVDGLYERMLAGKNKHHLYKIIIQKLELFDELNFPGPNPINIPLE